MFSSKKDKAPAVSTARPEGSFEIQVRKADGSIRKQFAEWSLFAKLRKMGYAIPNVMFLTGRMASSVNVRNLVTNAGFAGIALNLGDISAAIYNYIAVGTGAVAAAATDTTLGTELAVSGLSRATGTVSQVTTTITNDTHQVAKTFTVTGTAAVTEAGLLNAASAGTLLGRNVFSAVNVVNGDSLAITYKVKIA